jgi:hypothetical protein
LHNCDAMEATGRMNRAQTRTASRVYLPPQASN